jgi:hypothetical protein
MAERFKFSHFDKDREPVFNDTVTHKTYVMTLVNGTPKVLIVNPAGAYWRYEDVDDETNAALIPLGMTMLLARPTD